MKVVGSSVPVVFRLSLSKLAKLQAIARQEAFIRDRRITLSDVVREALDRAYPEQFKIEDIPNQGQER